jgi:hypothetical protein
MKCLIEVTALSSFDDAAEWAKRVVPLKNNLTAKHALEIEAALADKLPHAEVAFGARVAD